MAFLSDRKGTGKILFHLIASVITNQITWVYGCDIGLLEMLKANAADNESVDVDQSDTKWTVISNAEITSIVFR